MKFNLNYKKFRSEMNSENGEVSDNTIFSYFQEENIIWADYHGGEIIKGHLIGTIAEDNSLEFVYHHINTSNEVMTGKCISYPEITNAGKIRLKEFWEWTCKDFSKGKSILIET